MFSLVHKAVLIPARMTEVITDNPSYLTVIVNAFRTVLQFIEQKEYLLDGVLTIDEAAFLFDACPQAITEQDEKNKKEASGDQTSIGHKSICSHCKEAVVELGKGERAEKIEQKEVGNLGTGVTVHEIPENEVEDIQTHIEDELEDQEDKK